MSFIFGAVFIMLGLSLFSLGVDTAIVKMGEQVGADLTKSKKVGKILLICFLLGVIVTVAEPDLIVLSSQLAGAIDKTLLIVAVAVGVGIFLTLAMLRLVFQIPLRILLFVSYAIAFILALFVPKEFVAVAFDSGGVTTGPMIVPFTIALGIGAASTLSKNNSDDNFGFVAFTAIGPIIAVLTLGIFADSPIIDPSAFTQIVSYEGGLLGKFFVAMPGYFLDVLVALAPVVAFFLIYNLFALKLPHKTLGRMLFGLIYVYLGLVLFLSGVNVGFSPMGAIVGKTLIESGMKYLLIPVGMAFGFCIIIAEPAVKVLTEQVEEISDGTIKSRTMLIALMGGMSIAIGLSLLRILTGISIWWIILPVYVGAFALTFFVPKIYTAVAFDSGGVASGPMTATFMLPLALGACAAMGGNILTDAFGLVAFVSMTPLLTIQAVGLAATVKAKRRQAQVSAIPVDDGIIEFDSLDEKPTRRQKNIKNSSKNKEKTKKKKEKTRKKLKTVTEPQVQNERKNTVENKVELAQPSQQVEADQSLQPERQIAVEKTVQQAQTTQFEQKNEADQAVQPLQQVEADQAVQPTQSVQPTQADQSGQNTSVQDEAKDKSSGNLEVKDE